jgi:hypothetical protein
MLQPKNWFCLQNEERTYMFSIYTHDVREGLPFSKFENKWNWVKEKVKLSMCLRYKQYDKKTYEWMYRSKFSWPWHCKDGNGQLEAQASLPLEKEPLYTLNRRFGRPQCRSRRWGEEKFLNSTGAGSQDFSTVQPAASRYTDCNIPILISVARYVGSVLLQFYITNLIIWKLYAFITVSHGNMAFLSWN